MSNHPVPPPMSPGRRRRAMKRTLKRMDSTVLYGRLHQLGAMDEVELQQRLARIRLGAVK